MAEYYDELETRSADRRASDLATALPELIAHAQAVSPAMAKHLEGIDAAGVKDRDALARLPILRKSALQELQKGNPPFGGFGVGAVSGYAHIFQSPGPIYEPGQTSHDWWRIGRFLHACKIGAGDIVQNCFSYHLTPAGMMFENGAHAVSAAVVPAGTGQSELQAQAAAAIGVTTYAGTPDFLKVILDSGTEQDLDLSCITKAAVSGGALFPSLREEYRERGIACLQCYATADFGNVAYESEAMEGMIVDEGILIEIVTPGTGDPVAEGNVGEVIVTNFNRDYPLIRFATGDLSAVMPGKSPCGRTNMRIKGWMGRADQTAKVRGMFVRPEQVAALVERHRDVRRARVVITRGDDRDEMTVQVEADGADAASIENSLQGILKVKGKVEVVEPGSLPNDGKVIDDQRSYD
ncbi:MAG: phenylacetate--CoA ligase family protein [Hyphomicrobiaceae bacterium]|nr:phenylacetate--CoA ligase family protein [Hyphomicrobiaceae bacterium]